MSLSASLSNALSGMSVSQKSLEVLSRNVANSGTPGYHKQSLAVIDTMSGTSAYARSGSVQRAFNQSLQVYYTNAVSDAGYANTVAASLDRLQTYMGKPGAGGSLDTMFGQFYNSLQALTASPDNYATRASVVASAQAMATTLNSLTRDVQSLRQETETQMSVAVDELNLSVTALQRVNDRLGDMSSGDASRAALLDQRDRLVSQISELIDVRVDYRSDDTVALTTRSGVGILDGQKATFSFVSAGGMSAEKQFNVDPAKSEVGKLILTTTSGTQIDMVQQHVVQSGTLGALIELRDKTLVGVQSQLDEIAAGLAQALSTVTTSGDPASSGTQNGYDLDIAAIGPGNDVTLTYAAGSGDKTIRLVNTTKALDYVDANGAHVVGVDFSAGASAVASRLQSLLGSGFTVSGTGNTLTVLDDGAANTTDVKALVGHATQTALQNGTEALNLFVDGGNEAFTDSLEGTPQKLGFAGRITVNSDLLTDNSALVKTLPNASFGDTGRADYLLEQLQSMSFASAQTGPVSAGTFRLAGSVTDLIAQTMNYVGNLSSMATSEANTQLQTTQMLGERMESEYGVNVDEEMARLIELQNAYAANSRVIATVQELLNRLMEI